MAHSNGRIFIDPNTTGVEIADLQQVLGRGTGDLGLLCSDQELVTIPYLRVAYLESTGTQYIDTGVVASNTTGFYVDVEKRINNNSDAVVIGSRGASTNSRCWIDVDHSGNAGGNLLLGWNSYTYSGREVVKLNRFVAAFNYKNNRKGLVNGDEVASYTSQLESVLEGQTVELALFCANNNGTRTLFGSFRIYSVRITSGDTIVRDFVPVRVGDVGYMYDTVSGQLFGNSGSGSFVLGEDVGPYILRPVNRINKWAKFKPFRNSAIGFSLDKTQPTPELRSPGRLAQALLANYGLTIPKFNASDFKTHYSDPWVYNPPRGMNGGGTGVHEWFRLPDFDGYQHELWQVGPVGTRGIYTIFDGYLGVPNSVVFAGDYIQMSIQCAYDGDTGIEGLLYPYDFLRDTQSDDDLSEYYLGIALLDSQSRLWVITGDRMDSHHSLYDVNSSLVKTIPANLADGAFKAIPMLASYEYPNWDSAPGMGLFVSLNGQYLSLTKSSSSRILKITATVSFVNSGVTINISMMNQSSNSVTVSYLYGFYMSRAAESNEHDEGYDAPDFVDPGVYGFIDENWPSASLDPSRGFPLNDGPNIYVDDWAPNEGHYLAARAYSACFADFRTANGGSTVIASGATVSWSKRFDGVTEDDFGSYAEYMRYVMCVRIGTTAYIDIFIADE